MQGQLVRLLPYGTGDYLLITRDQTSRAYVLDGQSAQVKTLLSDALPNDAQFVHLGTRIGVLFVAPPSTALQLGYLEVSGEITHEQTVVPDFCTPPSKCSMAASAALGSGYVGVTWNGRLRRFAAIDLTPVDVTPIAAVPISPGTPKMAFDGTNFVITWTSSSQLRLSRVRASDGSVLDGGPEQKPCAKTRELDLGRSSLMSW